MDIIAASIARSVHATEYWSQLRLGHYRCLPLIASVTGAAETTASEQFAALLKDAWEFRLREDPLFATETGDHRYDDQLPKVSLADEKRRNAASREFLTRLEAIDRDELARRRPGELRHLRPQLARRHSRISSSKRT